MAIQAKAMARHIYATVPGVAAARFTLKELTDAMFPKREYGGTALINVGDGLIVDVGANRGHSIAAFRRYAPKSEIVAFEPGPTFDRLWVRCLTEKRVRAEHYALGSKGGSITFYVPKYGRWVCDGMAATSYEEATEWLKDPARMGGTFDPFLLTVTKRSVECRTLDSFDLAPRLIKLHAQGAEHDILLGSEQTIRIHQPAIMCAFVQRQPKIIKLLADWGYRPFAFEAGRFNPGFERRDTFTWFLSQDKRRP